MFNALKSLVILTGIVSLFLSFTVLLINFHLRIILVKSYLHTMILYFQISPALKINSLIWWNTFMGENFLLICVHFDFVSDIVMCITNYLYITYHDLSYSQYEYTSRYTQNYQDNSLTRDIRKSYIISPSFMSWYIHILYITHHYSDT